MTQNDLVPGSNLPPLSELLSEETAALAKRRDELLAAVERVPKEFNNLPVDYAGKVADLARMCAACIAAAESARKERKAPFLADGKAVDAAYNAPIIEPLEEAKAALAERLAAYQHSAGREQIRGELGSVSSLREEWAFEITDEAALTNDIRTLRRYFSEAAVTQAIRAFIRDGGRELKGCRIFKTYDVTVR